MIYSMKFLRRENGVLHQLINMQQSLATLLLQEENYWKQRSKVFWLANGDTNSKYFHASASARKRKNTIKKLRDSSGN